MRLLGIGCDIECVSRFVELYNNRSFLNRFFTSSEVMAVDDSPAPHLKMAELFCIKEAVVKSIWQNRNLLVSQINTISESGEQEISIPDIEIELELTFETRVSFPADQVFVLVKVYQDYEE